MLSNDEGRGLTDYRRACSLLALTPTEGLTPRERAASIPSWLVPELVATPASRERLHAWASAGAVAPTPDDLVRRLKYIGDDEVRAVVLKALDESIPPPVVAYLLEEAVFVGTGWASQGFCIRAAVRTNLLVQIGGASRDVEHVLDITKHEVAHAWLIEAPQNLMKPEEVYNEVAAAILVSAKRPRGLMDLRRAAEREELLADNLAAKWGGYMACSDLRERAYFDVTARALIEGFRGDSPGGGVAASLDERT